MRIRAAFEVTGWEQVTVDEPVEGPPRARAAVTKTFTGGLEGTGAAEVLICGEAAYTAQERITGQIGERAGSFVVQHGAVTGEPPGSDGQPVARGVVVPGSGTGDLTGITGAVTLRHDESGAVFTLDYELE